MKRTFFTGRAKRKLPERMKRSNSDDNVSESWSTDPKDLLDGFSVGSMSVPYPPPSQEEQSHPSPLLKSKHESHSRKIDKKAKKASKNHSSPLTSRSMKAPDSSSTNASSRSAVVISSPVQITTTNKRMEWASGGKLQRSCSLDALNEIEDMESPISYHPEGTGKDPQIRRSSTEVELQLKKRYNLYSRGISHQPESKTRNTKGRLKKSSLHESSLEPKTQMSPSFNRETSRYNPQSTLHEPKSVEHLMEALQDPEVNVNLLDDVTGNAPIHSIIISKKRKDRLELLLTLLINSDVDINLQNRRSMAAFHVAIEVGCEMCAKASIAFGAEINQQGCNQFTPLDLAINNGNLPSIEAILLELGAKSSTQKFAESRKKVPRLYSFAQKMQPPMKGERLTPNDNFSEFINSKGIEKLYNELEANVRRRMSVSATMGGADDTFVLVLQHRELALFNRTQPKPKKNLGTDYGLRGGSRILFLDGGGIKGLVQLEVLIQLEEKTQCSISDLFDWIVGTSTGGVIALAIVYAKKSLRSLRQLYFLLKNRIFMKSRYGFGYNSEALEDILQDYLDPDIKMSDVTHPKVLIAAVNKATTNLELHFFNNCFGDAYVDYPIWKVARYTSAAPMFFNEFENYVDGGVICNNPTDYGLTAIQNYCRLRGYKLPIAVVVSVGTGIFPAEKIGVVDAQSALFFGKQWLNPTKLIQKTQNLLSLLTNALVESEMVASNSRSRCSEQDIPFFRFSPTFDEMIAAGETDNEKLFNMIVKTKLYLKKEEKQLDELTKIFHDIADSSKDLDGATLEAEEDEPGRKLASVPAQNIATITEEEEEDEAIEPPPEEVVGKDTEEERKDETEDHTTDEDEPIVKPNEGIEEIGKRLGVLQSEEFADNFLFNSIKDELDFGTMQTHLSPCDDSNSLNSNVSKISDHMPSNSNSSTRKISDPALSTHKPPVPSSQKPPMPSSHKPPVLSNSNVSTHKISDPVPSSHNPSPPVTSKNNSNTRKTSDPVPSNSNGSIHKISAAVHVPVSNNSVPHKISAPVNRNDNTHKVLGPGERGSQMPPNHSQARQGGGISASASASASGGQDRVDSDKQLYRIYKADNRQGIDHSQDEYSEYNRETLV